MIKSSLSNYLTDFNKFVDSMISKMQLNSHKHKNYNATTDEVKQHLISEICELFKLDEYDSFVLTNYLINKPIDLDECKDVAIMCWALELSHEQDKLLK